MNSIKQLIALTVLILLPSSCSGTKKNIVLRNSFEKPTDYGWCVVGGGVAGILTVGLLHDLGVPYGSIAWIDPEFNVGRIGKYYENVPANNQIGPFIDFLNDCKSFSECDSQALEEARQANRNEHPNLGFVVKPLQDVTNYFCTKVHAEKGLLEDLYFANGVWNITANNKTITSHHVILATGAEPRTLDYEGQTVIPLDHALDQKTLGTYLNDDDVVGVFGGSHSGILLLKFLHDLKTKAVINFYRSPICYATDGGDVALNSIMGLKGATAAWAKEVLEGENPPKHIIRIYNDETNRNIFLPLCDKIIYAIGYERTDLPESESYDVNNYDQKTGIIAPRLFGIGLAFPEVFTSPSGKDAHRVGLTSFMDYAQRIIPLWLQGLGDENLIRSEKVRRHRKLLEKFEDLFIVNVL